MAQCQSVSRRWAFVAMILMTVTALSTAAVASGKKEHGYGPDDCSGLPPGQAKKNPHCGGSKKKGPPPWAPAHGHRQKGGGDHYAVEDEQIAIRIGNDIGISVGTCRRETIGAVMGGVVGGVIGNEVGDKSHKEAATIAGAAIGILVGKTIGRQMDQKDQQCTGQVLERVVDGESVRWMNDSGIRFDVTPLETFNKNGLFCRKYQTVSVQNGKPQQAQLSACRQKNGSWKAG